MSKKKPPSTSKRGLPPKSVVLTEEGVLRHLENQTGLLSPRRLARQLGLKKESEKVKLFQILHQLKAKGLHPKKPDESETPGDNKTLRPEIARGKAGRYAPSETTVVGCIKKTPQGARFIPCARQLKHPFFIQSFRSVPQNQLGKVFEATVTKKMPPTVALGKNVGELTEVSKICTALMGLPSQFPSTLLKKIESLSVPALEKREDVRHLDLVTIDGADSRDFDDAVWAQPFSDGEVNGWHLIVAVADVAHYVKSGSELDQEALERGTSVYFPDRVIPMLPEKLSNDLCSLRPREDRACVGVHIWINEQGEKLRHQFFRGLMKSSARLTYEEVQKVRDDSSSTHPCRSLISQLYGAYKSLEKARLRRGTLEIEMKESYLLLDSQGKVQDVSQRSRLDSHRLIEEFMISANVAAAEFLKEKKLPCLYRTHDKPDPERVENLRRTLQHLKIPCKEIPRKPQDFTNILQNVRGSPYEDIVNELVLRCQNQAVYSPDNIGHFGLNLRNYCHFTSPIRRYPDLLTHRAILTALGHEDGLGPETHNFENLGQESSIKERRADAAQREANDRFLAEYFSSQIGKIFQGYVSGISPAGIFLSLPETGASGLVPMPFLGAERFILSETPLHLKGAHTQKTYYLGDRLEVILKEADLIKGRLTFSLPKEPSGHGRKGVGMKAPHAKKKSPKQGAHI